MSCKINASLCPVRISVESEDTALRRASICDLHALRNAGNESRVFYFPRKILLTYSSNLIVTLVIPELSSHHHFVLCPVFFPCHNLQYTHCLSLHYLFFRVTDSLCLFFIVILLNFLVLFNVFLFLFLTISQICCNYLHPPREV
jgi:hypothetical protein